MSPTSPALPSLLSYLPSEVLVHDLAGVFHVFPATGLTLPIYFALKGKHGYQLENREKLVFDIQRIVAIQASQHDCLSTIAISVPEGGHKRTRQLCRASQTQQA
jgi:hypothetical protein